MQSVDVVMKLFKVMSEEEKRETIMQIGALCEESGLTEKWTPSASISMASAPAKKRRSNWKTWWSKRVDEIDMSATGMDKVKGAWASNFDELPEGTVILVGVKHASYHVCKVERGMSFTIKDRNGVDHVLEGLRMIDTKNKFADIVSDLQHALGS